MRRSKKRLFVYAAECLTLLYLILLIPIPSSDVATIEQRPSRRPFAWNQDARWDSIEGMFAGARKAGCEAERSALDSGLMNLKKNLAVIEGGPLAPTSSEFALLERQYFTLAPLVGACPDSLQACLDLSGRIRAAVKHQSERWNTDDRTTREILYRLLYGTRSATEELILQTPPDRATPSLVKGIDEPSATPAAAMLGVVLHSGDILVSRGGAATSALIARGNDFQGNFSHVALIYIDSATGKISLLESHIERGVAIASADEYLNDTKLRVMVLRVRSDLPAMVRDPLLPHRAASYMLGRARAHHIPYNFSMDYTDTNRFFCSQIVSAAYLPSGIRLWMGLSHLSSTGVRSWLADYGVSHFETQEPSDLEYDPQLRVVAEWRERETLSKDHIDNAATDAMLEGAERGDQLRYNLFMLPVARVVKAYSSLLNLVGRIGPIPEGMSATSVLKHRYYTTRHAAVAAGTRQGAIRFRSQRGYEPPYWELLRIARIELARLQD